MKYIKRLTLELDYDSEYTIDQLSDIISNYCGLYGFTGHNIYCGYDDNNYCVAIDFSCESDLDDYEIGLVNTYNVESSKLYEAMKLFNRYNQDDSVLGGNSVQMIVLWLILRIIGSIIGGMLLLLVKLLMV